MTIKFLELRDRATFIPCVAFQVSGADGYLARRAGFESPMVYLVALSTERCAYDPYHWDNRSYHYAHLYIAEHWDELKDHDVVDVEFIRGETTTKKVSESQEVPA